MLHGSIYTYPSRAGAAGDSDVSPWGHSCLSSYATRQELKWIRSSRAHCEMIWNISCCRCTDGVSLFGVTSPICSFFTLQRQSVCLIDKFSGEDTSQRNSCSGWAETLIWAPCQCWDGTVLSHNQSRRSRNSSSVKDRIKMFSFGDFVWKRKLNQSCTDFYFRHLEAHAAVCSCKPSSDWGSRTRGWVMLKQN